jgi:hypothetical protein
VVQAETMCVERRQAYKIQVKGLIKTSFILQKRECNLQALCTCSCCLFSPESSSVGLKAC